MQSIIGQRQTKFNPSVSRSSFSSQPTTDSFSFKRPSLPPIQFKEANNQKRIWLKAVIQECNVKANELIVLEALAFLTDPVYGHGTPSIGAIQEKCLEMTSSIHRRTVENCLKRLEQKGAILRVQRGAQKTNEYRLIGFEYESEGYYEDVVSNPNSSPSLRRERGGSKIKNNKNSHGVADAACELPEEYVPMDKEKAKLLFEDLRKQLRGAIQ